MTCEKCCFKSKKEAMRIAHYMAKKEKLRPYYCKQCHAWHFTSSNGDFDRKRKSTDYQ